MNSRFWQILLVQLLGRLHRKQEKAHSGGFTLIELLVVIIIIGILAAIALPSFLSQTTKARQAEARSYVGALNKGQHAYYSEKLTFTTDINKLGVGLTSDTQSYQYTAEGNLADLTNFVTNKATSRKAAVRSFVGVVAVVIDSNDAVIKYMICNSNNPDHVVGGTPIPNGSINIVLNEPACPIPGFSPDVQ